MTATLPAEARAHSRRALLAGALGGMGAWVASTIGRVSPARATNGDTVTVGNSFTGTSPTAITNSTGDGIQAGLRHLVSVRRRLPQLHAAQPQRNLLALQQRTRRQL